IFRGSILGITRGVNIGPMEPLFRSLGQSYLSTGAGVALAAVTVTAIFLMTFRSRRERIRDGLPVHAAWMGGAAARLCAAPAIPFFVVMGLSRGIPVPVIILITAAMIFTFSCRRTQRGRYPWAIGGNLEAAKLSGVNVRRVTVQIFALMGLLAG